MLGPRRGYKTNRVTRQGSYWPSVTMLSSSGLRIPSRGSSASVRGVRRPEWDWGVTGEPVREPMSRPAEKTRTHWQTKTNNNIHEQRHQIYTHTQSARACLFSKQPFKYNYNTVWIRAPMRFCLHKWWSQYAHSGKLKVVEGLIFHLIWDAGYTHVNVCFRSRFFCSLN